MDKNKISKDDFEYLCSNTLFLGQLLTRENEDFEIENETELTDSIYKLRKSIKTFEYETGYTIKNIALEKHH